MRMPSFLTNMAFKFAMRIANSRPPDLMIGGSEDPYMRRWWVIPRNNWFNIYMHHFRRSDDPRALHDHPYWNASFLVSGCYTEVTHTLTKLDGDPITTRGLHRELIETGEVRFRWATDAHRIELTHGECWTFFLTGRRVREWGFWCRKGWRHWKLFAARDENGASVVGAGCGEQA